MCSFFNCEWGWDYDFFFFSFTEKVIGTGGEECLLCMKLKINAFRTEVCEKFQSSNIGVAPNVTPLP